MQNRLIFTFLALALGGQVYAQQNNAVNFTILGEINHRTCTIGGGADKTVTMNTKTLSDFTTNEVDGGVDESITLTCPSTTPIKVTVTDRVQTPTSARNYLVNKTGTCNNKTCATGVGVKLKYQDSNGRDLPNTSNVNIGTEMVWRAASTGAATSQSVTYKVRPSYLSLGTPTTGGVEAQATLTFAYQ